MNIQNIQQDIIDSLRYRGFRVNTVKHIISFMDQPISEKVDILLSFCSTLQNKNFVADNYLSQLDEKILNLKSLRAYLRNYVLDLLLKNNIKILHCPKYTAIVGEGRKIDVYNKTLVPIKYWKKDSETSYSLNIPMIERSKLIGIKVPGVKYDIDQYLIVKS